MNPNGILAGIVVVQHNEPYGNFSIEVPQFPAQFRGKNIRDPFRVGGLHAVSRATNHGHQRVARRAQQRAPPRPAAADAAGAMSR